MLLLSVAVWVFFLVFGALTVFVIYMKNQGFFDPTSPVAQHFAPIPRRGLRG